MLPSASWKPVTSTSDMNGPTYFFGKLTTATAHRSTNVPSRYGQVNWSEALRTPSSGPKSVHDLKAERQDSRSGPALVEVQARLSASRNLPGRSHPSFALTASYCLSKPIGGHRPKRSSLVAPRVSAMLFRPPPSPKKVSFSCAGRENFALPHLLPQARSLRKRQPHDRILSPGGRHYR